MRISLFALLGLLTLACAPKASDDDAAGEAPLKTEAQILEEQVGATLLRWSERSVADANIDLSDVDVRRDAAKAMSAPLRDVGIDDPDAEFWIERDDSPTQLRFGTMYSRRKQGKETVHEVEVACTPKGGDAWACALRKAAG